MRILIIILLFSKAWACDGISFEQLINVPLRENGKLVQKAVWGPLPTRIDNNSYDIKDLRIYSNTKDKKFDATIEFYKKGKIFSSSKNSVNNMKSNSIGSGFGISYQRAQENRVDLLKITISKYGKQFCKKEIRIWFGD